MFFFGILKLENQYQVRINNIKFNHSAQAGAG